MNQLCMNIHYQSGADPGDRASFNVLFGVFFIVQGDSTTKLNTFLASRSSQVARPRDRHDCLPIRSCLRGEDRSSNVILQLLCVAHLYHRPVGFL